MIKKDLFSMIPKTDCHFVAVKIIKKEICFYSVPCNGDFITASFSAKDVQNSKASLSQGQCQLIRFIRSENPDVYVIVMRNKIMIPDNPQTSPCIKPPFHFQLV